MKTTPPACLSRLIALSALSALAACGDGVGLQKPAAVGEPGWRTATLLETNDAGDARTPQVAFDGSGNGLAVWQQLNDTTFDIWWSRYTVGKGWSASAPLAPGTGAGAQLPQIAAAANGSAMAVWQQPAATHMSIWASRYTPDAGWDTPVLLETGDAGNALLPHVAWDGQGNALAVWYQSDGSRFNTWANRYSANVGWGGATLIGTPDPGDWSFAAGEPQVALDANGNAVVVWQQYGIHTSVSGIWTNRYRAGIGWDSAAPLVDDKAADPQVAMDSNGNALAVWEQGDGTSVYVWSSRYTPTAGWSAATQVSAAGAEYPQVAFNLRGDAVVAWEQKDGTQTHIGSSRYTLGVGWDAPLLLNPGNGPDTEYPQVASDPDGNALVSWQQLEGAASKIWSARYVPGTGWGTPVLIEAADAGDSTLVRIAMSTVGDALAVWQQSDGKRTNIWSNRFESGKVLAPF